MQADTEFGLEYKQGVGTFFRRAWWSLCTQASSIFWSLRCTPARAACVGGGFASASHCGNQQRTCTSLQSVSACHAELFQTHAIVQLRTHRPLCWSGIMNMPFCMVVCACPVQGRDYIPLPYCIPLLYCLDVPRLHCSTGACWEYSTQEEGRPLSYSCSW